MLANNECSLQNEEETWGKKDVVLEGDAENIKKEYQKRLKEKWKQKRTLVLRIRKKQLKSVRNDDGISMT